MRGQSDSPTGLLFREDTSAGQGSLRGHAPWPALWAEQGPGGDRWGSHALGEPPCPAMTEASSHSHLGLAVPMGS